MTTIYRVRSEVALRPDDPLHVGNFYDLERRHHRKMQDRQDLILYLANIHTAAIKSKVPLGFCLIPMRLMTLRDWVHDYKPAFDHFFEVVQEGYHVGDRHEISMIRPKRLRAPASARKLVYLAPQRPAGATISKVYVQQHLKDVILAKLAETGRLDLHAPVSWLLGFPEINFHFAPSGKLQLRDTSVWPISAIETWPAWLREALFGPGIDIEAAYVQFLIEHVRKAYLGREEILQSLYPDLLRSLEDKTAWRREICEDILGLDYTEDNIAIVKKICMSLANGSRISPSIMLGSSSYSVTRDIILKHSPEKNATDLIRVGERLGRISKQYSQARKIVCNMEMMRSSSRSNQKAVFGNYFEWEREARYQIWEAVGRHGIMVHDGIDGIPEEYLGDIPGLVSSLNLRLSRS